MTISKLGVYKIIIRKIYQKVRRVLNRIRFGKNAPVPGEIIWVNPRQIRFCPKEIIKYKSIKFPLGKVVLTPITNGETLSISEFEKVKYCIRHWEQGLSWEESGAIEFYKHTSNKSVDYLEKKFKNLELVYEQIKKEGKLRRKKDADPTLSWPGGEGVIHIDIGGQLLYQLKGGSDHRLAIAYILNIPYPARVGMVHVKAIPFLDIYRRKPTEAIRKEGIEK